jgi:hypothetical protein
MGVSAPLAEHVKSFIFSALQKKKNHLLPFWETSFIIARLLLEPLHLRIRANEWPYKDGILIWRCFSDDGCYHLNQNHLKL